MDSASKSDLPLPEKLMDRVELSPWVSAYPKALQACLPPPVYVHWYLLMGTVMHAAALGLGRKPR